jgi:hypothetical protein
MPGPKWRVCGQYPIGGPEKWPKEKPANQLLPRPPKSWATESTKAEKSVVGVLCPKEKRVKSKAKSAVK